MEGPSFWAHNDTLYMAKRHLVVLGCESDSQSTKKLKALTALVKYSDIGLELSGGGRAPSYCNVDTVLRIVHSSLLIHSSYTLVHAEFWPFPTHLAT